MNLTFGPGYGVTVSWDMETGVYTKHCLLCGGWYEATEEEWKVGIETGDGIKCGNADCRFGGGPAPRSELQQGRAARSVATAPWYRALIRSVFGEPSE